MLEVSGQKPAHLSLATCPYLHINGLISHFPQCQAELIQTQSFFPIYRRCTLRGFIRPGRSEEMRSRSRRTIWRKNKDKRKIRFIPGILLHILLTLILFPILNLNFVYFHFVTTWTDWIYVKYEIFINS